MSELDPPDAAPSDDPLAAAALGSATQMDFNADGVVDALVVANADGTTDVFTDQGQDGRVEGAVRFRADGSVAAVFQDADQNGTFEVIGVDQSGNGVIDGWAVDTTGSGQVDTAVQDLNENGIADTAEAPAASTPASGYWSFHPDDASADNPAGVPTAGFVGPVTNPDPVYSLILDLVAETGQVVYPPDDSDFDGWPDKDDARPHDPDWR